MFIGECDPCVHGMDKEPMWASSPAGPRFKAKVLQLSVLVPIANSLSRGMAMTVSSRTSQYKEIPNGS